MQTIVIGGGAAGMLAAYYASESSRVTLIEKNEKLGKKLFITGKGRCNLTNCADDEEFFSNVISNPKFLYSAIKSFDYTKTMDFFESRNLKLKVERGNRVFPFSDKSSDVIKALQKALEESNVDILLNEKVLDWEVKNNEIINIITDKDKYHCDKVILSTGGKSYPLTGSTGDGYILAEKAGHKIIPLKPALVALDTDFVFGAQNKKIPYAQLPSIQGLSLKNIRGSIINKDSRKILFTDFGEMLFTDKGVSGPIILSLSSKINRLQLKNVLLSIDLKPALDFDALDKRIIKEFDSCGNKYLKNSLNNLLPSSIIPFIVNLSAIEGEKTVNTITKTERNSLATLLKNLNLTIDRLDSIDRAVITAGGINTKEIDPKTMKSKIIHNLYFAGEIIDVDALTGGYNLQIAFSTAYVAGKSIADDN